MGWGEDRVVSKVYPISFRTRMACRSFFFTKQLANTSMRVKVNKIVGAYKTKMETEKKKRFYFPLGTLYNIGNTSYV